MNKLYYNSLLIISLLFFWSGAIYRLYQMNYIGIFLTLILVFITFSLLNISHKVKDTLNFKFQIPNFRFKASNFLIIAFYFLLLIFNFYTLFQSQSFEPITSPWQVVPWYFFITYTLATIVLFSMILLQLTTYNLKLILISLHLLLSISVALIVYAIGYGYDPFIHQATEKLISQIGAVTPKPFYYLGQYGFVVLIHKLTFIPIVLIDKLLLPVLAVLFLPFALFNAFKNFCVKRPMDVAKLTSVETRQCLVLNKENAKLTSVETRQCLVSTVLMLIFPFSYLTLTTPQNLGFLFLILIILLNLSKNPICYPLRQSFNEASSKLDFIIITLAFATTAIHPLAGIPAILFVTINYGKNFIKNKKLLTFYYSFLTLISALIIPALFYINNLTNPIINSASSTAKTSMWQLPRFFLNGSENFLLNFIYLYKFNIAIIILIFIITGIIIYNKKQKIFTYRLLLTNSYFLMSLALLASYIFTKFINFNYLISYERSAFADRILLMAIFFTLPFIMLVIVKLIANIFNQNKIIKYSLFIFLVLLITTSLYISYPRIDNYENSKSYSTSIYDIKAVNWIEENSVNDNFIVLANQQVTAAALREFGFKKYYKTSHGEYFYYPIPTGEKLYQYYLSMVENNEKTPPIASGARKTAVEAADLVGADTTYLVLNNYWWNFDKVLLEAKYQADEIKNIDNKVYIFKYKK